MFDSLGDETICDPKEYLCILTFLVMNSEIQILEALYFSVPIG